ncbi:MAG: HAMP domain-containing protein, partial [Bdellovibrionales bacterium]|nr:HAMP domain-containing protein [Bdellovibrionales bacterium]
MTGYSLVQFESAISEELHKRLKANAREMEIVMGDLESYLGSGALKHASDPALQGHLSSSNFQGARRLLANWLVSYSATRVSVFDREGRLVVALYRNQSGGVENKPSLESGDVFLADSILKRLQVTPQFVVRDLRQKIGLELIVYTRVLSGKGQIIGYLEDIILIDRSFLSGIHKRLNLDVVLMDQEARPLVSTKEELLLLPKGFYREQMNETGEAFFEVTHRQMPYGFLMAPLRQGDPSILLGLAASKGEIVNVTKGINRALFSVVGMIIVLIVLTLFSASNMILKPLNQLVEAAEKIEKGEVGSQLSITNDTELGLLMDSFNRMSVRLADARSALEMKIGELEKINKELHTTQAQLVQSAKMVSLGQLVAGVAHELNNPIGFIYSNMNHLRDYGDRLTRLVRLGESDPKKLKEAMVAEDFEYMDKDLPRLIRSCEDGARRVRDIVLGLRNFSRLDEIQVKEVDIEEGIRNTLQLLSGELKNRIQ